MLLILTGCAATEPTEPPTEAPTEPAPQPHTVAPMEQDFEPEWTIIDRTMALTDDSAVYAEGSDFSAVALVGDEASAELRFRFTDETAAMLRAQTGDTAYSLTMDGESIGGAQLNDECTEATLTGDFTYTQLCRLANRIRGFE